MEIYFHVFVLCSQLWDTSAMGVGDRAGILPFLSPVSPACVRAFLRSLGAGPNHGFTGARSPPRLGVKSVPVIFGLAISLAVPALTLLWVFLRGGEGKMFAAFCLQFFPSLFPLPALQSTMCQHYFPFKYPPPFLLLIAHKFHAARAFVARLYLADT